VRSTKSDGLYQFTISQLLFLATKALSDAMNSLGSFKLLACPEFKVWCLQKWLHPRFNEGKSLLGTEVIYNQRLRDKTSVSIALWQEPLY
jgi:hypothetical protein